MSSLGTYLPSYKPWTPSFIIPEPGESLTWDWMDGVSQFSQRFRNVATHIATINYDSYATFSYEALGCDYFPPILKAYYHSGGGTWKQFDFGTTLMEKDDPSLLLVNRYGDDYVQFQYITLGSCVFYNGVYRPTTGIGSNVVWKFTAYM